MLVGLQGKYFPTYTHRMAWSMCFLMSIMLMTIISTDTSKMLGGSFSFRYLNHIFWDLHYGSLNFNGTDSKVWALYLQSLKIIISNYSAPLCMFKSICCSPGWFISTQENVSHFPNVPRCPSCLLFRHRHL